jgi:hydrogenase nickel incorporation protein HypB
VQVHESIFAANDRLAERNRGFFRALGLFVLNVVSSPGSGKTTLIQKTIEQLGEAVRVGVIVGDLETDNDARRLRTTGAPVVQITTGTLCHLDAEMVARAVGNLKIKELEVLIIENVGNLVCPASFDLGEDLRLALLAVTEGEDKPLKYPPLFRFADVVVITKIDLARAVEFNREAALANIQRVNPKARIFEVSARTGQGMEAWCEYIISKREEMIGDRL